jgi:LysM repeat protein
MILRRILLILALILTSLLLMPSLLPVQAQQGEQTYVVQPGDTLFRISLRFNTTVPAIAQLNGISNPNLIFVGQRLRIPAPGTNPPPTTPPTTSPTAPPLTTPPPTTPPPGGGTPPPTGTYTVQPGDTLFRIAVRFGTTPQAIAQANGIVNINRIFVGQVLRIPTGGGTTPPPTPTPGGNTGNPPPPGTVSFALGGQVLELNANTQTVLRGAKMTWVKRQIGAGDANGENIIRQTKDAGFRILLSVVGDKNAVVTPSYQDQYAAYVAGLARAGADAIEVWNEPNLDREWVAGQISGANYTQLLRKAYTAIKAANAATIVISGAPAPTGAEAAFPGRVVNDDRFYAQMAAAGAAQFADCIGVHYNEGIVSPNQTSGDPRDNYPTRYFDTMLRRALASFPGKLACYTEIGYLSPEGYGQLPPNFSWAAGTDANEQAVWLGQAAARARQSGRVGLFIVFNIDFPFYTQDDPQAGFAIIRPGNQCFACAQIAANVP